MSVRPPRFYVPELDGLRGCACLAVFVAHASQLPIVPASPVGWESPAWWTRAAGLAGVFGVDLFFVLSSFLITSLLVREADSRGRIDVPAFWVRRALRIWPLYYAAVALGWWFEALPARVAVAFGLFAGNWPIARPLPERSLVGVLWSVSLEEQFYLVWPLVLTLVPRRALGRLCLAMIAVSLVTRAVLAIQGTGFHWIWMVTPARLDPLAVGTLIALRSTPVPRLTPPLARAVGVAGIALVVVSTGVFSNQILAASPDPGLSISPDPVHVIATVLLFLAVAVACGGILVAALASPASWLGRPPMVVLGRISYGFYVVHLAALRVVESLWWPWRFALGFAIAVLLAGLSYRFLERPFLRLKARFTHVRSAPADRDPRWNAVLAS